MGSGSFHLVLKQRARDYFKTVAGGSWNWVPFQRFSDLKSLLLQRRGLSPAPCVGGTGGLFSSLCRLCWPSQTSGQLTRLNGAPPGGWPWSLYPAWAFVLVSGPWLDPPWVRLILQWPAAEGGGWKGDAARWWGAVRSPGEASGPGARSAAASCS